MVRRRLSWGIPIQAEHRLVQFRDLNLSLLRQPAPPDICIRDALEFAAAALYYGYQGVTVRG